MLILDLAITKEHLLIYHNEDDNLITHYLDASKSVCEDYTHGSGVDTHSMSQARLLLVGSWYAHRENSSTLNINELPDGVKFILDNISDVSL